MLGKTADLFTRARQRYEREGLRGLGAKTLHFGARMVRVYRLLPHILLKRIIGVESRSDLRGCDESIGFGGSSTITITAPEIESSLPDRLAAQLGTYTRNQPFVVPIEEVQLIGKKAIPLTDDGIVLEAFSSRQDRIEEHLLKNASDLNRLLRETFFGKSESQRTLDVACSFASVGSGYCEWIQSVLTRLEGLEVFTKQTGIEPTLILPSDPPSWMVESIEFFGYDDWIEWDGTPTIVDTFVVPSVRTGEYRGSYYSAQLGHDDKLRIVHPGACKWLRETANELIGSPGTDRQVYISREVADSRHIVNRSELAKTLERAEITAITMESLSFREQVRTMRGADLVVGPHGAGLVNTVFTDQADVIELFGHTIKSTYFLLSNCTGSRYRPVLSDETNRGIVLDTDQLEASLSELEVAIEPGAQDG